jgi:hypothetical protein
LRDSHAPSAATLAIDILRDLKHLGRQQIKLIRHEIAQGMRQRLIAVAVCGAAVVAALLSVAELCFSAAHLLHWSTSPAGIDPATIPLWGCHAIVAAALALVGTVLGLVGRGKYRAIPPIQISMNDILA